jgi:transglutaminase-like putative cysteine protease
VSFETFFRAASYATLVGGALALVVAGGMSLPLAGAYAAVLAATWWLEGSRWQLTERKALALVLVALPVFYFDWQFQTGGGWPGAQPPSANLGALTHFILFLSAVKLWQQKKADRDWLFLYLISFFEVLLAAGLSVSPQFLASLALYLACVLTTVVCFEIRRARRGVKIEETRFVRAAGTSRLARALRRNNGAASERTGEARRLTLVALCLLALIFTLALPIFFITPRAGANALSRADGGLTGFVGFSDEVQLGQIGELQRSNRIVMRVRVDTPQSAQPGSLRWRGVALDEFDGRAWRRTAQRGEYFAGGEERSLFQFDTTEALDRLTTQTFFLEPMDTPALFIAPRAIAVQGALPYVRRDPAGGLTTRPHPQERLTYRAYSDTNDPPLALLRLDNGQVPPVILQRYLQLPANLDPRIFQQARRWVLDARAETNYDAARVIESHLRNDFSYTLDLKATGPDPLADFLFRVRAGHCEYFSTAMTVMLRSMGVAARVVNGFQQGEYNDAADAYIVRQSDAHSWVEVYFPQTDAWVSFDPTPAAGRPGGDAAAGWLAPVHKYVEALELFWIQYVVAYDKQEQRSLASTVRSSLGSYRLTAGQFADDLRARVLAWWRSLPALNAAHGRSRVLDPATVLIVVTVAGLLFVLATRLRSLRLRRGRAELEAQANARSVVNFYERMSRALDARGLRRAPAQTPLEFAATTGLPEALFVTRAYNRVRYGAQNLTPAEAARVEHWLQRLETTVTSDK